MADPPERDQRVTPPAPDLPDVDSPPTEDVLKDVPSTDEIIKNAESADDIVKQQPSVEELVHRTPKPRH
jgi:hypothetical protein